MTSPLPPKRRDTRSPWDLLRQDRTNLRQLNNGLMGGRAPMLRPLPSPLEDGDDEDDSTTDLLFFRNVDHTFATADNAIVPLTLTYEPVDGSLVVAQNGLPIPSSAWTLNGRTATIPPTSDLHIHAGDRFDALVYAYYEPDDVIPPGPLESLVLRGVTIGSGALPVETVAGDFVVIGTRGGVGGPGPVFTDPRFPLLSTPGTEGRVYAGNATDLSALAPSSGSGRVVVASFVGSAAVESVAFDTDPAHPSVPVQAGTAGIAVINERSSVVAGSISLPNMPPWLLAATDVQAPGWTQVSVCYWCDPSATSTPAVTPNTSGGVDEAEAFLLTLLGVDE